ncbi:SGNH/GDSL hydrolase family protein [Actinosynnema sp. NPDC023587]|uniref:SGNH/GDSL hydrolase family protein n=1 Tax=Actinosynnema sp. NPDC023587 TaxID=3154695 RepID=UPI0033DF0EE7
MANVRTRLAVLGSAAAVTAGVCTPAFFAGAAPAVLAGFDWVALGDSYTAGVVPAAGETFEVPRDGCDRTDLAYPQVVDRELGSLVDLTNVSCGAATVEDVAATPQNPIGRHLPPFSEDPDHPFAPVPPQSSAVGSATDLITVGAGGDTLGFAQVLVTCLRLGEGSGGAGTPCRDELADSVPARLAEVREDFHGLLDTLRQRAPSAEVVVVGYPTIVPADTAKCRYGDREQFASITPGDLGWLRDEVLEPLNAEIERAAGDHGDVFVDLHSPSRDHSACDSTKWVEGVFARSPQGAALVHPNARGHRNAANQVIPAILDSLGVS